MKHKKDIKTQIQVTIDGKVCSGTTDDTILKIARRNGIYIPTMCYLSKVEPIASCRMCVVKVDGVEGNILSCQERAVDGAVIHTKNAELFKQRQNIMKLYNVNHPLECGVCDKSGECDLQNKTLEYGVATQTFTTQEPHRPVQNWGFVSYDPALCIMCEKCVKVSHEITGNESLKIKMGGYKSTILNVNNDSFDSSLGESAAVCPVGALVDSGFKYSSNAWELNKIPSSCTHCSSGCALSYEVKNEKIYRVTNPFEFSSLCGAGRYGFDYSNISTKDEVKFAKTIEAFKNAKTINFSASITNEEVMILNELKKKYGYRLVCDEAFGYSEFLKAYASISGKSLYGGNLNTLSRSEAIIVIGSRVEDDNPMVKYHMTMASKRESAKIAYMHPIEDTRISNIVTQFIKYEVGSEEGVVALLAKYALENRDIPSEISEYLNSLDVGNLSAESNVGEEELARFFATTIKKSRFSIVIGSDVYTHPRVVEIAKILGAIEQYSLFDIIAIPPASNALGVALICNLDKSEEIKAGGYSIGYNTAGNYTLSSNGDCDMDIPALNQQEGTTTTIDKRVVAINVGIPFDGYCLNDVANALGVKSEYTIDYTAKLPTIKGFIAVGFDDLASHFDIEGNDMRGYLLNVKEQKTILKLSEPAELESYDGAMVYNCNITHQFGSATSKSTLLSNAIDNSLKGSAQFAQIAKLTDGESVIYKIDEIVYNRVFRIDTTLKGTIAINPTFDMGLSSSMVSTYRYKNFNLEKTNIAGAS